MRVAAGDLTPRELEALTGGLLPYGEEDRWTSGTAPRTLARAFRRQLDATPEPLAGLVAACLDPDPTHRPPLSEIRQVLDTFLNPGTLGEGPL